MGAFNTHGRPWWAIALACLAWCAIACSPGDARAAESSLVGTTAPDFVLRSAAGANQRLSEYRSDVVVLSFWSSRCRLCRARFADLERLQAAHRDSGLVVLGISIDSDVQAAREWAAARKLQFPLLFDPSGSVARAYRVDALPMLVAIDRFGTVRFVSHDDKPEATALHVPALRTLIDE